MQDLFESDDVKIPEDFQKMEDLRQILVYASLRDEDTISLQRWSCAILKVMHVISHINNDLYAVYQEDIRKQILLPIKEKVYTDAVQGASFLQTEGSDEKIRLNKFELKPLKNQTSAVIKLLAKKRLVALNILDRIGVRFVTKNTFDIFRVIRFLVDNALVSYPHCITNESANMVYPTNLFLEAMDGLRSTNPMAEEKDIEEVLLKKLEDQPDRAEYNEKDNKFTDPDYKFVKFISRKLVSIDLERDGKVEKMKFFYPFEVQIMDYETYVNNMRGPLSHGEYKKRQVRAAYHRLFGEEMPVSEEA